MQIAFKTFGRGAHPPARKSTSDIPIAELAAPERLFVPLSQHIGAPAVPVVKAGDAVKAGDVLLILEAMKMENEIMAPVAGTVSAVNVTKGASVNSGDVLCVIG